MQQVNEGFENKAMKQQHFLEHVIIKCVPPYMLAACQPHVQGKYLNRICGKCLTA